MTERRVTVDARVGDRVEAHQIHGGPPRRGTVVSILGQPGHEHYLVHWDLGHESVVYPSDGVVLAKRQEGAAQR
jgi:hypothetical protein